MTIKGYLSDTFRALHYRDYRLFAFGQAVSVCGMWAQRFAQAWLVLELTNSSLMLGITVALQQIPLLFFTAAGGALADRFDRRRILLLSNALGILPALALGVLSATGVVAVWMIFGAALFQGLTDALEKPARMTLVNDIVEPGLFTNAVMLNNVIQNSGKLIGPGLGGILVAAAGVPVVFFVNAASYLPVLAGLWLIHPMFIEERDQEWQGSLRHTLGYVAKRRRLLVALSLVTVVGIFGYNFQNLIPVMFRNEFHAPAATTGLGLTFMGLGGVVGGVALAGKLKASSSALVLSALGFGVGLVLLGVAPNLLFAYLACIAVGTISTLFSSMAGAHIQLSAEREMRGRLIGLYLVGLAGASPFGGALTGAIAQWTNGRVAFVVCAVVVLISCVAAYLVLKKPAEAVEEEIPLEVETL